MNGRSVSVPGGRVAMDRALDGAVLCLGAAVMRLGPFEPRWPLLMVLLGAAVAVPLGLGLAQLMRVGEGERPWHLIAGCCFMWAWHGTIQVFGFALPGLIGWHRFLRARV